MSSTRFLPYLFFAGTRGAWLLALVPVVRALIYLALPLTLVLGFLQSVVSLTRTENASEQPEHPSEAVDALIEAGQDEGILEESDRQLIHSVVEFGDKIVREVMRPRPEIFAVPASTTVAQLTEMLRQHPYSRVPVYEGDLDHIVGIVLARDLLQVSDSEAHHRTVKELMKTDLYLVPETKRGSQLLREMQRQNTRMAIVIDEYGGVAGLVTVEDLVEEIVGELREEGESKSDIIRESENFLHRARQHGCRSAGRTVRHPPGRLGIDDRLRTGHGDRRPHTPARGNRRTGWSALRGIGVRRTAAWNVCASASISGGPSLQTGRRPTQKSGQGIAVTFFGGV